MTDSTPQQEALLGIHHLVVGRSNNARLEDVSMQVERGSIRAIVGPNGGGKSTLLSAVLGLTPFSGRIVINWRGPGTTGYVPQTFPVDPTLPVTVEDFLALTRQRWPVCLGVTATTRRRIASVLAQVGLTGFESRLLAALSGGELRRVLLAHAMDPEPELLILDEPASGLDAPSSEWLEGALLTLKRAARTTIVLVSHDFDQVRRLADRVTVLDRRVLDDGEVAEVLARERSRQARAAGHHA